MKMCYLDSKTKENIKVELSDNSLVHLVLLSLPTQFDRVKVNYNCQKSELTLNELISYCVE